MNDEEIIKSISDDINDNSENFPIKSLCNSFADTINSIYKFYIYTKQKLINLDNIINNSQFNRDYLYKAKKLAYDIESFYEVIGTVLVNIRGLNNEINYRETRSILISYYSNFDAIKEIFTSLFIVKEKEMNNKTNAFMTEEVTDVAPYLLGLTISNLYQFKKSMYDYSCISNRNEDELSNIWWSYKQYLKQPLRNILKDEEKRQDLKIGMIVDSLNSNFDIRSDDKESLNKINNITIINYINTILYIILDGVTEDLKKELNEVLITMKDVTSGERGKRALIEKSNK